MKNQRKKIVAVILLIVVLVLGVASIFVATRLNTQTAVAPNAPTSEPLAALREAAECGNCGVESGYTCPENMVCKPFGFGNQTDTSAGICVRQDAQGKTLSDCSTWLSSAACKITANISGPACLPRPSCLDEVKACNPAEPAGGYCAFVSCNKIKQAYKNVAGNTAGVYNLETNNEIKGEGATKLTVNPGQIFVYAITYSAVIPTTSSADTSPIEKATITDLLDSRLEYLDGQAGCTEDNNLVTCVLDKTKAMAGGQVAFRVKVKEEATLGALSNNALITTNTTGDTLLGKALCTNTAVIAEAPTVQLACKKKEALNEAGTSLINTIANGQTFQYSFDLMNSGDKIASDVILTDVLPEKLIFVDSASGCTYAEATRTVSCKASLNIGETKKVTFKVKTINSLTDGEIIGNTATAKQESSVATVTGSECEKDLTVAMPIVASSKKAYRDNTNNTAGVYHLTESIDSVTKNQVFVYAIELENSGSGTASGVIVTDTLTGVGQDQLTLVDRDPKCEWSETNRVMTCRTDVQPGEVTRVAFRVKVSDGIANGTTIKNAAEVTGLVNNPPVATKDLSVSTVVACNHTCVSDSECETGYSCDTASKKCRKPECLSTESCVCPGAATEAPARTVAVTTQAPARATVTQAPAAATATEAPVGNLPSAGILDIPGVAIFGGGLILAVIGLLLAL